MAIVKATRQLMLTVEDKVSMTTRVFMVEWPEECHVSAAQFYNASRYAVCIDDLVLCENCAYHLVVCAYGRRELHHKEVNCT